MSTTSSTSTVNRWVVLAASVAILLCAGVIYSFSVFAIPLVQGHEGWTMGQVMNAFIINGAIAPIPMILGGYIIDRGGARWSIMVGAILFVAGFALTGTATSLTQLYLYYGLIAGLGVGFIYSGCLNNTIKLFPDRRGFAAGVITAGMGAGTVIAAPIARGLIADVGVGQTFVRMGVVYAVIAILASLFIRPAPVGYAPAGWTPPVAVVGAAPVNKTWREMLATPQFYVIFLMLTAGAFSGLLIVSQLSPIAQTASFGITAATAAVLVSVYSICNASGRFVWGAVSDRIGYVNATMVIYTVVGLSMVLLLTVQSQFGFTLGIIGLGLCFGGVMGVFPALTMKTFGPRFQGVNYGILFTGYSIAAYFGPKIGSSLGGINPADPAASEYTGTPFVIAIGVAAAGLVLAVVLTRMIKAQERSKDARELAAV